MFVYIRFMWWGERQRVEGLGVREGRGRWLGLRDDTLKKKERSS